MEYFTTKSYANGWIQKQTKTNEITVIWNWLWCVLCHFLYQRKRAPLHDKTFIMSHKTLILPFFSSLFFDSYFHLEKKKTKPFSVKYSFEPCGLLDDVIFLGAPKNFVRWIHIPVTWFRSVQIHCLENYIYPLCFAYVTL